jgi:hypothetical protein
MTKKKLEEDSQLLRNRIALLRVCVCGGGGRVLLRITYVCVRVFCVRVYACVFIVLALCCHE